MNFKYVNIGETGKFVNINFENNSIMVGSLFSENDIVNIKNIFNENDLHEIKSKPITNAFFNFDDFRQIIISNNLENIFEKLNIVIITNIEEALSWPFILRRINHKNQINDLKDKSDIISNDHLHDNVNKTNIYTESNIYRKIKFISTEPITQISKTLLHDFYDYFNKIMSENILDYQYFVNSIFINEFVDSIININYNCEFKIDDYLKIILGSSGYNLGSSNILFKFYNKKIVYLSKSCLYDYRYPKHFEFFEEIKSEEKIKLSNKETDHLLPNKNLLEVDILICSENSIKFEEEYIPEYEKFINTLNGLMQQYDRENNHFPSIFLPSDPLFILDFIDIKRFKTSNDIKCIFLSKIIKSVLEYGNVSHGFLNKFYHNKIYDFKLPFDYEEMMKNGII